ncbi:MAG: hypothetical protein GXP24_13895 [Planctomycetes bacterium]|nr:hypothetical protein [Planctomycetota bacterium]
MLLPLRDRPFWIIFDLLLILGICLLWPLHPVEGTTFDWDNFSGSSAFADSFNWRPTAGGPPPGVGDAALFDGQLENLGIGNNTVNVPDGTAIDAMQVTNSAGFPATVVDMTIGDGTTSSRFDLDQNFPPPFVSLAIGSSPGDTATLNLLGGWLDTYHVGISGRATFNVVGEGSYWDSGIVVIRGDTVTNTAGIGLGNQATIRSYSIEVGNDTSSGRVVVDGSVTGLGTSSLWTVTSSVDIGPTSASGFNFGSVTLQRGGQMDVGASVGVHGTGNVASTLTVQTGGDLDVAGSLNIGPYGVLELFDPASTITTGDIDNNGGTLDWTGGTLHIDNSRLRIDDSQFADLEISSLTIGSGKSLIVSLADPSIHTLTIGNIGSGSLAVVDGGTVQSYRGTIGETGIANGSVTVTDLGSIWTVTDQLRIGQLGNTIGQLSVLNQGEVAAYLIWLGSFESADGTLRVDGAGSTVTTDAELSVGGTTVAGGTGRLTVENGGAALVGGTLRVFGGGTVNLTGGGSRITADTLRLEPGATFVEGSSGTLVRVNHLVGFGNNPSFVGNLQIGHSGGSGLGSHTVGAGQTLSINQSLTVGVDAPATLLITGGTVNSHNGFIGGAAGSDGSWVDVNGAGSFWFANQIHVGGDGIAPQSQASLAIANDAQAIVSDRIKVWGPGTLLLDGGIISTDFVEVEGELLGNGAIVLGGGPTAVINRGIVAPGLSAGVLTINGNASSVDAYVQETGGRLVIEIGGTTPGYNDRLDIINGSAALAGILDVLLIDPLGGMNIFVPKAGDSFEVLSADNGLVGRFDTQAGDLPALTGELFWEILYGSTFVRLDVFSPFSADFDRDGDVDNDDRTQWEGDYGINGDSDANGDGDSDGGDYLIWQRQFGSGVPVVVAGATVPEPSTLLLMVGLATLALITHRGVEEIDV